MRTPLMVAVPLVLAVAVLFVLTDRGRADGASKERLSIAAQGGANGVWILDRQAGKVKLCVPPLQRNTPPDCTAWATLE